MAARRSPEAAPSALQGRPVGTIKKGKDAKCLADLGHGHLDRDDFHELQLPGILETLLQLQNEYEVNGAFLEAEIVRKRHAKLQSREKARQHEEYQSRQIAERLGVEEAHMQELQEFNEVWDGKDEEFEAHVVGLQETLMQRHAQTLDAYRAKIEKETDPRQPKWSREHINLKTMCDKLAKQKSYVEAAKVKEELDKLESKEYAMWKAKRDAKLAFLEEQFMTKQQMEMTGLISRIEANRNEHKLSRKKELERLLQRYHNVKKQMESQQKIKYQKANQYRDLDWETGSVASSRPSNAGSFRPATAPSRSQPIAKASLNGAAPPRTSGMPPPISAMPANKNMNHRPLAETVASRPPPYETAVVRPSGSTPALTEKAAAPRPSGTGPMAFEPPRRSVERSSSAVLGRGSAKMAEPKRNSPPIWK